MATHRNNRAVEIGQVMPDGRVNHGGLHESIHNRPAAGNDRSNYGSGQDMVHGRVNHRGLGDSIQNRPAAGNDQSIGQVMADGRINHGGLRDSIHNKPKPADPSFQNGRNGTSGNRVPHRSSHSHPAASNGMQNGHYHGSQHQSAHVATNSQFHLNNDAGDCQAQPLDTSGEVNGEHNIRLGSTQAPAPRRLKIKISGGWYTLEQDDRDELWRQMNLKAPAAYQGCESWVIPFPEHLNLIDLVIKGYGDTCLYLDERWVRLAYRTHHEADGKQVATDLILTPPSSSIDIRDVRFRNALADAWWKVGRWMYRVMHGENIKLWEHLEGEAKHELTQKLKRM
ncbi:hypothetical protein PG984_005641 [Apiospora sp. TS-2023a]